MNIFKSKKFRQGSFAAVLTVLGLAIILLLSFVLGTLSNRMDWKVDMTRSKIFAITDETKDYLKNLDKDVTIYVLNSEDGFINSAYQRDYFVQANEMMHNYESYSKHISIKYVDITKDPTFVSKFTDEELSPNNILLVSGDNSYTIDVKDLFNTQQTQYGLMIASSRAEQTLTSAILSVTSDEQTMVTVLGGHDEIDTQAFADLLELNNYQVTQTNIVTEDAIDPESTIAIINAPARDYTEDELNKVDAFLENDGNYGKTLLYIASYQQGDHNNFPNLNAFLAEWGLKVGDSFVYEASQDARLSRVDPFLFVAQYTDSEEQPQLKGSDFYNFIMDSKPVEILFDAKNSRTTTSLLESSEYSGVYPEDAPEGWMYSEKDLDGPHSVMAMSAFTTYRQTTPLRSNVVVLGSADALAASTLQQINAANSDYFVSLFDKVSDRGDTVRIEAKQVDDYRMNITMGQAETIGRLSFIVVPIVLVAVGLFIWLRRRHK